MQCPTHAHPITACSIPHTLRCPTPWGPCNTPHSALHPITSDCPHTPQPPRLTSAPLLCSQSPGEGQQWCGGTLQCDSSASCPTFPKVLGLPKPVPQYFEECPQATLSKHLPGQQPEQCHHTVPPHPWDSGVICASEKVAVAMPQHVTGSNGDRWGHTAGQVGRRGILGELAGWSQAVPSPTPSRWG